LFLSSDLGGTSTATSAVRSYYRATSFLANQLKLIFKTCCPEVFELYEKAFEAGVWFTEEDPGPFLGRAVLWKLQVGLHRDKGDVGPSIAFPFGSYEGGEMVVPQLHAKLAYRPRDIIILLSSKLWHQVLDWRAGEGIPQHGLTPGRGSQVFFMPKRSLEILQDKPPYWGVDTAYG
ncbi:hypothetical protein NEOLEDRAFT_1023428, partial [Neolentinus lepideus HHB14362 ss-1]